MPGQTWRDTGHKAVKVDLQLQDDLQFTATPEAAVGNRTVQ
jgi:hypothetical protein